MQVAVAVTRGETGPGAALGRQQAFRAAITPLVDVAFRVLRRLGVRDEEMDDALQTVLVVVDRRFDDFSTQQDLKAYLCASCVNVARNVGRSRSRYSGRNDPAEDLEEIAAETPDPEDILGKKEALELLQRILRSMAEERRVVLVLHELEELTSQEIAEHLGIPIGTVSSRLRKAREEFRSAIARVHATDRSSGKGGR